LEKMRGGRRQGSAGDGRQPGDAEGGADRFGYRSPILQDFHEKPTTLAPPPPRVREGGREARVRIATILL
jgi:hypothetical protein